MQVVFVNCSGVLSQTPSGSQGITPSIDVVAGDGELVQLRPDLVEEVLGLQVQRHVTMDAEVLLNRRLISTSETDDWRLSVVLVLEFDALDTVHRGVLHLLSLARELGDVPRDDGRPAGTTLAILDERLGLPTTGEPIRVRLPEVRRRDRAIDPCALGGIPEALQEHLIADAVGVVQLRPQVVVVSARVVVDPLVDVRDSQDEVDVVLAALAVDACLDRVFAVSDLADCHVVELTTTEATLELQHEQCGIPSVSGCLPHRLDVLLKAEHVGLVRRRVVVASCLRRDPLMGVGDLVVAGDVLGEHPEGHAVVAVGLLAPVFDIVSIVNPSDDGLRGFLTRVEGLFVVDLAAMFLDERLAEGGVGFLAHPDTVTKELLVAVPAVVLTSEFEFVAEVEEDIAVTIAPTSVPSVEFVPEGVDGILRVGHEPLVYPSAPKGLVESPPPASTFSFTSPRLAAGSEGGVSA